MDEHQLKLILEALLASSSTPLTLDKIQAAFHEYERPDIKQLQKTIDLLQREYKERAIEIKEVAGGYRIQTKSYYSQWIERLLTDKPPKYSRAVMETLAIIAYKQPVTRADIEEIRGVAVSSSIIRLLLDREWVRIAGYRDVPGKPAVYTTTKQFLNYFNLGSLNELPELTVEH